MKQVNLKEQVVVAPDQLLIPNSIKNEKGLVFKKIAQVMKEIEPIAKNQQNTQQRFNFRGIDDIYNSLQPILAKHGLFCTTTILNSKTENREVTKTGAANNNNYTYTLRYHTLTIQYKIFAEDGSFVTGVVEGVGMDTGDKGSNKAMAVAHKYFLTQLFMIPTQDMDDPDKESIEPVNNGYSRSQPANTHSGQDFHLTPKQMSWYLSECKRKNLNPDAIAKQFGFGGTSSIMSSKFMEMINYVKSYNLKNLSADVSTNNHATGGAPPYDDTDIPM
jgi:hypothetical protein